MHTHSATPQFLGYDQTDEIPEITRACTMRLWGEVPIASQKLLRKLSKNVTTNLRTALVRYGYTFCYACARVRVRACVCVRASVASYVRACMCVAM